MKKLASFWSHPEILIRQIFRSLVVILVLIITYLLFPVERHIHTEQKYSESIWDDDGQLLAYRKNADSSVCDNVPVLSMDSATVSVFQSLIDREDPRLFSQNSLWDGGPLWLNFHGISGRNLTGAGGSTLSQQSLKNLANRSMLASSRRTISSKIGEMSGSFKMSFRFSPKEILQLYINNVSFGKQVYGGVLLNALTYFDVKSLNELNLYERYILGRSVRGVRIAGIYYDSLANWSRQRVDSLFAASFRSMLIQNGRASEDELATMLTLPIRFRKKPLKLHTRDYLWGITTPVKNSAAPSGSQYITTLKNNAVSAIDDAFLNYGLQNKNIIKKGKMVLDANAVIVELATGRVIGTNSIPLSAILNDTSFSVKSQLYSARPAASLIKPLLIATGLDARIISLESMLLDKYVGRLHSYNHPTYYGFVTLRTVIQKSLNTPIDNHPGRNQMISILEDKLQQFFGNGLRILPADENPSQYVIGQSRELSVMQVAAIYRALLSDGIIHDPSIVRRIIGTDSFPFDTLYQAQLDYSRIFSQEVCASMKDLLTAPLSNGGTLSLVNKMIDNKNGMMGKTGTSDSWQYGWCVLADSRYLVVVSMNYVNIGKATNKILPVPSKSGGGSAGVIAALIFNNLK